MWPEPTVPLFSVACSLTLKICNRFHRIWVLTTPGDPCYKYRVNVYTALIVVYFTMANSLMLAIYFTIICKRLHEISSFVTDLALFESS
jgi:hypothetical protein